MILYGLLTALAVLIFHLLVFSGFLDWGTNTVMCCANLFVVLNGFLYAKRLSRSRVTLYAVGYLVLFLFLFALAGRPLLFSVIIIGYAALYRLPLGLGYLFCFVVSIVIVTPYWLQSFILLSLLCTGLFELYRHRHQRFQMVTFTLGCLLILIIFLPLLYLIVQSSPQTLLITFKGSDFQRALLISVASATITTLVVLVGGVPLAYTMTRMEFRGKRLIDSLIDLPILIPQTVAGIALLVFLGPKTPFGEFLQTRFGISIAGSLFGIVAAQIFVSAPFLIRGAMNAFDNVSPKLEHISRTLGVSPTKTFFRISLPLAAGGIFNGCILTWSRAISEVGSLMVLAYHPFTVSIFTYDTFTQYGLEEAQPVAILLVIICLWIFIALRWIHQHPLKLSLRTNG